jgi:hypothetical protein
MLTPSSSRRARHSRGRRWIRRTDDAGQSLVFVLLVSALVLILVGTSVALSTSNIRPSRETADRQAALAAAQAGIDEFALALNRCGADLTGCGDIAAPSTHDLVGADGDIRATYRWEIVTAPDDTPAGVLRLAATGVVRDVERTLVADFRPTPDFLDFLSFTERETIAPETVLSYFGPRTVELPSDAIRARVTKIPTGTPRVTWSGAMHTEICAQPWYDTVDGSGRQNLRYEYPASGHDFRELTTTGGYFAEHFGDCEVSYGPGVTMDGRVYSKDALLFTNSVAGGQGPMFEDEVFTEWGPDKEPPPDISGRWYRSNAQVGGDPRPGSQLPQVATSEMSMPETIDDLAVAATCTFTGPTRIRLQGQTAVVTSPLTEAMDLGADCAPGDAPEHVQGSGLAEVTFPISGDTVFYVEDGEPVEPTGPDVALFDLSAVTAAPVDPAQPELFFTESDTDEAALRSAASGGDDLSLALDAWLVGLFADSPVTVGAAEYRVLTPAGEAAVAPTDPLYEALGQSAVVSRRTCTEVGAPDECTVWSEWADAFTVTLAGQRFPWRADITPYETGRGTAFVEGGIDGRLTVGAEHDVVITDDLTYVTPESILGLVADSDVEIHHPVGCRTPAPVTAPGGTCPDDITGLYAGGFSDDDFDAFHPSRRYLNLRPDLDSLEINAAMLARQGSMVVQNFLRGPALGSLAIKGGVYARYRGATGIDWEAPTDALVRERSGYVTSMSYDSRLKAQPPPSFAEPEEAAGSGAWQLVSTAERVRGA